MGFVHAGKQYSTSIFLFGTDAVDFPLFLVSGNISLPAEA